MSSSQPIVRVPKRTRRAFSRRTHQVCRRQNSVSSVLRTPYPRNSTPPVCLLRVCCEISSMLLCACFCQLVGQLDELWSFDEGFRPQNPWSQRAIAAMCDEAQLPTGRRPLSERCESGSTNQPKRGSFGSDIPAGKKNHTPPCSGEEHFFVRKKWGPQRKGLVVDMPSLVFKGFFVSTTGLESSLRPEKFSS